MRAKREIMGGNVAELRFLQFALYIFFFRIALFSYIWRVWCWRQWWERRRQSLVAWGIPRWVPSGPNDRPRDGSLHRFRLLKTAHLAISDKSNINDEGNNYLLYFWPDLQIKIHTRGCRILTKLQVVLLTFQNKQCMQIFEIRKLIFRRCAFFALPIYNRQFVSRISAATISSLMNKKLGMN